jgi:hypothetical protein
LTLSRESIAIIEAKREIREGNAGWKKSAD